MFILKNFIYHKFNYRSCFAGKFITLELIDSIDTINKY